MRATGFLEGLFDADQMDSAKMNATRELKVEWFTLFQRAVEIAAGTAIDCDVNDVSDNGLLFDW